MRGSPIRSTILGRSTSRSTVLSGSASQNTIQCHSTLLSAPTPQMIRAPCRRSSSGSHSPCPRSLRFSDPRRLVHCNSRSPILALNTAHPRGASANGRSEHVSAVVGRLVCHRLGEQEARRRGITLWGHRHEHARGQDISRLCGSRRAKARGARLPRRDGHKRRPGRRRMEGAGSQSQSRR